MKESNLDNSVSLRLEVLGFWRRYWLEITTWTFAFLAVVLGYIGFSRVPPQAPGPPQTPLDIFYLTVQLFVLQSGVVPGPVPPELNVARFLAPLATAGAILKALHGAVQEISLQWLRFRGGHIVVCGLGRKGLQLAGDFHRSGDVVVAIEKDEKNDAVRICRALGVLVLLGDATDKDLLKKARVYRAKHVVAICRHDAANLEIALHSYQLAKEKKVSKKIRCHVHVVDLHLLQSLHRQKLFVATDDPMQVNVFNSYANCARQLFLTHHLDRDRIRADDPRLVHLVIIGFERMGQSVLLQAAKIAHFANGKKLRATVVDAEAESRKNGFLMRYPQFDKVCEAEFLSLDPDDLKVLEQLQALARDASRITTIVICLENDSRCFSYAMNVQSPLRGAAGQILVQMAEQGGLATLFEDMPEVVPFGMTDAYCTKNVLLHEDLDTLAQTRHAKYCQEQAGRKAADDPALKPWSLLNPDLQDSNRQAADHIPVKLRAIGCVHSPAGDEKRRVTAFSPEEVELLARMEHARWNADRFLAGWMLGPRNPENRTSPHLVCWEELGDDIREYDREAVRDVIALLDKVGERVYRCE